jgi:2-iminobutanoate/2-iminopropanoate deaminase
MDIRSINSPLAPSANGGYPQGLEVTGIQRLLFISGQVPETPSGQTPADFLPQARLVWTNVIAQLEAAQMSVANLVKVTTFLSARAYAQQNREVRQEFLGSHAPALTVVITGIYDESWLLEVEAIAAA